MYFIIHCTTFFLEFNMFEWWNKKTESKPNYLKPTEIGNDKKVSSKETDVRVLELQVLKLKRELLEKEIEIKKLHTIIDYFEDVCYNRYY